MLPELETSQVAGGLSINGLELSLLEAGYVAGCSCDCLVNNILAGLLVQSTNVLAEHADVRANHIWEGGDSDGDLVTSRRRSVCGVEKSSCRDYNQIEAYSPIESK